MSAPIISFLSLQGRVGQTSLIYHLAWMLADLDVTVLAVDLDPQAALTLAFATESVGPGLLFPTQPYNIQDLQTARISDRIHLVPGHLSLAASEDARQELVFAGIRSISANHHGHLPIRISGRRGVRGRCGANRPRPQPR